MKRTLLAAIFAGSVVGSAYASSQTTHNYEETLKVVQSHICPVARQYAMTCNQHWRNMSEATSGQAGSFYECMKVYCDAMTTAGCSSIPIFC
jgi:hypothetical protein